MLSGSRTRAERLAKDLQEEGLAAFYGQDYDREILPGEIMVVYGHAKKGTDQICGDDRVGYFWSGTEEEKEEKEL